MPADLDVNNCAAFRTKGQRLLVRDAMVLVYVFNVPVSSSKCEVYARGDVDYPVG
ncbi:MAG: hypothetical protein ACI92Z_002198 [Paracoccaceae bacterium]|jgi:hypothetical protein